MQSVRQLKFIFGLSNIGVCFLALLSAPIAGALASFYTNDPGVILVGETSGLLNALFMPFWAASWVLPAGLKGARDARYTMWVSMLGMWGCRIVAGYTLGVILGWGVNGVWMGMFLDWIVRAVLVLSPYGERPLAVALYHAQKSPDNRRRAGFSAPIPVSAACGNCLTGSITGAL